MTPSLISILIFLIVVGAILYVIKLLPIDATIKTIATVIVVVFIAIRALTWLSGSGYGF